MPKRLNNIKKDLDIITKSLNEKGFSSEQQEHFLAAIAKGFDVSSITAIDNTFSTDEIDRFTDLIINNDFSG